MFFEKTLAENRQETHPRRKTNTEISENQVLLQQLQENSKHLKERRKSPFHHSQKRNLTYKTQKGSRKSDPPATKAEMSFKTIKPAEKNTDQIEASKKNPIFHRLLEHNLPKKHTKKEKKRSRKSDPPRTKLAISSNIRNLHTRTDQIRSSNKISQFDHCNYITFFKTLKKHTNLIQIDLP